MPERSDDFNIINHILSQRYGFTQIGMTESTRVFFQNKKGIRTHFFDREDSFTDKNLVELADQIKVNADELVENFKALKQLFKK